MRTGGGSFEHCLENSDGILRGACYSQVQKRKGRLRMILISMAALLVQVQRLYERLLERRRVVRVI